jgi:hypothetical protein
MKNKIPAIANDLDRNDAVISLQATGLFKVRVIFKVNTAS